MATQILIFKLEKGRNYEGEIYRIPKGGTVRFILGASLYGHDVSLFTNNPMKKDAPFIRDKFISLPWQHTDTQYSDEGTCYADCNFPKAGSFRFYYTLDGSDSTNGNGYLLVDPVLKINDEVLPFDGIQCQTVLSKCLGPFADWMDKIIVAKETGYNFVHFTPIQALGGSNSGYSLLDHKALNKTFTSEACTPTFDDIRTFVETLHKEHKILSLTDIVLNHTANETPWLREHPECSFNAVNSPHLRPAMLLDQALYLLSIRAMRGELKEQGLPPVIDTEDHLSAFRSLCHSLIIPVLKLHEFYLCDVDQHVKDFEAAPAASVCLGKDALTVKHRYTRFGSFIDIPTAKKVFSNSQELRNYLNDTNGKTYRDTCDHLNNAVENVIKGMRYHKLDPNGPKQRTLTKIFPLTTRYFLINHDDINDELSTDEMEKCFKDERGAYFMAHNGWVMGDDPLKNFAMEGPMVYLRRELIAWGDSCKLRYGDSPADCPFLWEYMKDYVVESAKIFHGLRLDNCHSTPIHVAEYLLDAAREAREDLYVIAELFTSSEWVDNIFVNRLSINSLIREALQAGDSHELGRLVHRYGGIPVGSFFHAQGIKPLMPSVAHAIFVDMTHDNPSPYEKRSIYDFLPSSALVSMASCATGSNRGYDELVPHHIHVVDESRQYSPLSKITTECGMIRAKKVLNDLHHHLATQGYNEVYVDQLDYDTVSVTRRCPHSDNSVVLVAKTAFQNPHNPNEKACLRSLTIPGIVQKVIIEARIARDESVHSFFTRDPVFINGLQDFKLHIKSDLKTDEATMVKLRINKEETIVDFTNLTPGSVVAFKVCIGPESKKHMDESKEMLKPFGYFKSDVNVPKDIIQVLNNLDLTDINRIMFRCDQEERSDGLNFGHYNLEHVGPMLYCGLQGVMTHLSFIRPRNDLGHPLCSNIRNGNWLMDYLINRLKPHQGCVEFSHILEKMFAPVKNVPHYLKPCYFDAVVTALYCQLLDAIWSKMSKFISTGSNFVKQISLSSVILCGFVYDSPLPQLSSSLKPSPRSALDIHTNQLSQQCSTMAAGLPHFSTGYMRNWGRDTFIALRGLLLLTGRYNDARNIILGFAGCLRHGLIPNLLDRGNSRYNCRDAVWFWLQSIKQYVELVPQGEDILNDPVSRLYPKDDSPMQKQDAHVQPLQEVMQEALQRHWEGIRFRERNAGTKIDSQMTDEGFNIEVGVDYDTGFVYGGNAHNCGTWMDKMGSIPGRNQGVPASPRDGSAVELVGLCKSVITWLHKMNLECKYSHSGVLSTDGKQTSFLEWSEKIQNNFEKYFYIPVDGHSPVDRTPDLIFRRGIYKDTLNSQQPWADYQFRPNFTIAMVVAPELFAKDHAQIALAQAENLLQGPLGMKTLDPGDQTYNENYDNSDADGGFNYHRGPEWVWPMGYYLRARLIFAEDKEKSKRQVRKIIKKHFEHLESSPWKGLPELTNDNGNHCSHSCPIQAWSHACLLEVIYQIYHQ